MAGRRAGAGVGNGPAALKGKALPADVVLWGEVGLTGEVRSAPRAEARAREAARQGFLRCILPAGNVRGLPATPGLRAQGVAALDQLFDALDLA